MADDEGEGASSIGSGRWKKRSRFTPSFSRGYAPLPPLATVLNIASFPPKTSLSPSTAVGFLSPGFSDFLLIFDPGIRPCGDRSMAFWRPQVYRPVPACELQNGPRMLSGLFCSSMYLVSSISTSRTMWIAVARQSLNYSLDSGSCMF